jgi:hypothetical protein
MDTNTIGLCSGFPLGVDSASKCNATHYGGNCLVSAETTKNSKGRRSADLSVTNQVLVARGNPLAVMA